MRYLFMILIASVATLFGADDDSKKGTPPSNQESQMMPAKEQALEESPQEKMPPVSYQGAFVKMFVTLFGLVILIILSVWLLRRIAHGRFQKLNYGRSIKVLERRPLSAKSILYLIEVSGKKVLISESQFEVRRIANLNELSVED